MTPTAVESRVGQVPPKYRALYLRVLAGRATPRACVKVMCYECMGWEVAEVGRCRSVNCPLWRIRPGAKKGGVK